MKNELVHQIKNDFFTNTKIVSENLEVPHKVLLITVEKLIETDNSMMASSCHHGKSKSVFLESSFTIKNGNTYKMYEMNKKAYMLLAMQLGRYKKGFEVQVAIIEAFEKMALALQNQQNVSWIEARQNGKVARLAETDVLKEFVDYATEQGSTSAKMYYMNITKLTNKALEFIIQDKTGVPVRDLSSLDNLGFIMVMDKAATVSIQKGMQEKLNYKHIYQNTKAAVNLLADVLVFKKQLN